MKGFKVNYKISMQSMCIKYSIQFIKKLDFFKLIILFFILRLIYYNLLKINYISLDKFILLIKKKGIDILSIIFMNGANLLL